MKYFLSLFILFVSLALAAQNPAFNFNSGIAASLKYANDFYGDRGSGVKAEMGYLTQLTVGSRLRGRLGIGASIIINHSNNRYEDIVTRLGQLRFDRDTLFSLRSGNLNSNFLAVALPLEYRFVSDGRIPWTLGITYQPGIILLKSGGNSYTEYDMLIASRQRLNETPGIIEKPSIAPFTHAVSLNFGYETDQHLLRLTIGRDYLANDDGFLVEEFRWLFGFEIVKWLRK